MIKWLLCTFIGHRFIVKAYTGGTMQVTNGLGTPLTASLYTFEKRDWCVRCGKPSPWAEGASVDRGSHAG